MPLLCAIPGEGHWLAQEERDEYDDHKPEQTERTNDVHDDAKASDVEHTRIHNENRHLDRSDAEGIKHHRSK